MNWIIRRRSDARQFGPLNDAAVRRWAWDGYIQPPDEVSDDNGVTWVRAGELAWLADFLTERDQVTALVGVTGPAERYRRSRRTRSLLDLTPMIDCVFLLLLFFFVTASFEKRESSAVAEVAQSKADVSLDVSVPRVEQTPESNNELPHRLVVVVAADGSVMFEGETHTLYSLQQAMHQYRGDGRAATVVVLASPDVQYRHIAATVAAIEAAGIERVLLGAAGPDE